MKNAYNMFYIQVTSNSAYVNFPIKLYAILAYIMTAMGNFSFYSYPFLWFSGKNEKSTGAVLTKVPYIGTMNG